MTTASLESLPAGPSHRTLEQAAEWFALLDSGEATAADRERWQAWLAESAQHQEAWRYVERIGHRFAPIKTSPERHTAIDAYRQASGTLARRRRALLGLGAMTGGGLLAWGAWRQAPLPAAIQAWTADYRTGTGEIREFTLADDTRIYLNALSAFDQDYGPAQRRLHLRKGEILVDTGADPLGRPFYVETPQGRLQALGTRFAVRLEAAQTLVAVYEGAVDVRAIAGGHAVLHAGQQTRFTRSGPMAAEAADPAREAWTRGLILARDTPLAEVVRELRRHYTGHLGLAPDVADLRVFGGYPANDPGQALAMLESVLPIRVRRTLPWWVSIEPREQAGANR